MNAAIRAVTRSALDQGMTVYGVRQGWQGLVDGQFRRLNARDVGGIIQVGGTFLGTARSSEFRDESGRSKALRNLAQQGIDGVTPPSTLRSTRSTTCAQPVPRTIALFWLKPWEETAAIWR
jgi:6-phosphofructokinase